MRQLLIWLGNNVLFKVNICSKYQATKLTVLCKEGGKKKRELYVNVKPGKQFCINLRS